METRRSFVMKSLALGTLVASPLQPAYGQSELQGITLGVATYGGSWQDAIEQHIVSPLIDMGASISYELGNPDDNLAKLIAARRQGLVPFDTIEGSSLTYPEAYGGGFFEDIDYSKIPGVENSPDWARQDGQLVVTWAPDGIVYNEEKFRELGISPPESYLDLMNPQLMGHVAFPIPSNVFHWAAIVALAYEAGSDEENLEPALGILKKINPVYYYNASAEVATRFGSGDIWAAPLGAGWAVRLKRSGEPIGVTYGKIGPGKGALWPGPISIVRGTTNLEASHAYLAAWFGPEGPAKFAAATGSIPVNGPARAKFFEQDGLSRTMLPSSEEAINNTYRIKWDKIDRVAWRDTWNREIQG